MFLAADTIAQVGGKTGDSGVVLTGQLRQRHTGPGADHFGYQTRAYFNADQTMFGLGNGQSTASFAERDFQNFDAPGLLCGCRCLSDGSFPHLGQLLTQLQQSLGQILLLVP
ncbi:hypothetical protein D3C87_1722630 [compost metagenome]